MERFYPDKKKNIPIQHHQQTNKMKTQRKTHSNFKIQTIINKPKAVIMCTDRQDLITYLDTLKDNRSIIQNYFQEQTDKNIKRRSYHPSPVSTPVSEIHNQIRTTVHNTITRKQLTAIKAYNHVHNKQNSKVTDQPQIYDFVQEAIRKSTKKYCNFSEKSNKKLTKTKFPSSSDNINNSYAIGENRKQLQKLEIWIKDKTQNYKQQQKNGQIMITERINFLNMAFGEVSRIVGIHCSETKRVLEYIMKEYHDYYIFLSDCMTAQNKKLKSQIGYVEQRLSNTIFHYQQRVEKMRVENDKKSQKVFHHFHKCIQLKKLLQKQNKDLKKSLLNQKNKLKFMEEGLIQIITLFLTIGDKSIDDVLSSNNLSSLQQNNKNNQDEQKHKKKRIFEGWCGHLIKMIHNLVLKDSKKKKIKNIISKEYFKYQAFQVIQKYLVENDSSLSLDDARKILNQLLAPQKQKDQSNLEKVKNQIIEEQKRQLQAQIQGAKNQVELVLPTMQQVYQKIMGVNQSIQTNLVFEVKSTSTQCIPDTSSVQIMAFPRVKNKQVNTTSRQNQMRISSLVYRIAIQNDYDGQSNMNSSVPKKIQKRKPTYRAVNKPEVILLKMKTIQRNQSQIYSKKEQISQQQQVSIKQQKNVRIVLNKSQEQKVQKTQQIQEILKMIQKQKINTPRKSKWTQRRTNMLNKKDFNINDSKVSINEEVTNTKSNINGSLNYINDVSIESDLAGSRSFYSIKKNNPRKKGILLINKKKKSNLSLRFIVDSQKEVGQQDFIDSNQSISKKSQADTIILSKKKILMKNFYANTSKQGGKYRPIEQRVVENRSFYNLSKIQYASRQDADRHKSKHYTIRPNQKKKTHLKQVKIDQHQFHIFLAFRNYDKIKFLSSITLWNPKSFAEFKKSKNKLKFVKVWTEYNRQKTINMLQGFIGTVFNPILKQYLKIFTIDLKKTPLKTQQYNSKINQVFKSFLSPKFQKIQRTEKKQQQNLLSYKQRICPLIYPVINYINEFKNKYTKNSEKYLTALKSLRKQNTKMQIYNILIEQGCVELDIFIKSLYYFNIKINQNMNETPMISHFVLENILIEVLEGYFTINDIEKISKQVKNGAHSYSNHQQKQKALPTLSRLTSIKQDKLDIPTKLSKPSSDISFFDLIRVIFRLVSEKKALHNNKYSMISTILSKGNECTHYEDIIYFLNCLPIQNQKKRKILNECLNSVVFWEKNQPMIPNDLLYFIFDRYQLYKGNKDPSKASLINDYIINRCELYFKSTLKKIMNRPEWVLTQMYNISYKSPQSFNKLINQLYTCKDKKQKKMIYCLLTLIYGHHVDVQINKNYMPALFNGLISVPYV